MHGASVGSVKWCQHHGNVCVARQIRVCDAREEHEGLQCIANHPGFQTVCLDPYVLQVAYYQYRQQYEERPEQGNALKRYTAYRQFVRWCWHFLGKEVRVVIPSCAVVKIRTAFPDENYTGFHQADSDRNGSISSALLLPCLVCHTHCKVEVVPQCTAGCLHHSCGILLRLKMLYSLDSQHNLQEKIQIKN